MGDKSQTKPAKPLCRRITGLEPSMTLQITQMARKLKDEWSRDGSGRQVYAFSIGEPDFDTPPHIVEAAADATRSGKTHYTPSLGIPELREAVAAKCSGENGIDCTADNVLITPCKLGIFAAINSIVAVGDEVIIPDPGWVSYDPMVRMAEGTPVFLPTTEDDGYQITGDLVRKFATDRTKLLILNSPGNPTGGVLTAESLKSIADAAMELDIYVISDEIYEKIHYGEGVPGSIAALPGMMERTVTANGFSKAYAMTGWRVGYMVAPPDILSAMNKVQQHTLTCTSSVAQYAAMAAITGPCVPVTTMLETFRERRDYLHKAVNDIAGLSARLPDGAFYLFFSYDADISSLDLCMKLLEEEGLALTPGSAFGPRGEGFLRFSYAASMEMLEKGVEHLAQGYAKVRDELPRK